MFDSEERRIAERIKEYIKNEKFLAVGSNIMLRNGRILNIDDYRKMVSDGRINPQDAYVYIGIDWTTHKSTFYYPFVKRVVVLLDAYLSKLGFRYLYSVVPTTGLNYVADAVPYEEYLTIEVTNLDTVANNINLPKIVVEVLGSKLISGEQELTEDEYKKISRMFRSQRLLAGHNFKEVWNIIEDYYDKGNQSIEKEVARIGIDYYKIFDSYRICYDMKTWKELDCWKIKR